MFKSKLKLVQISGDNMALDQTLIALSTFREMLPIEAATFVNSVHGLKSVEQEIPLVDLKGQIDYLKSELKISSNPISYDQVIDEASLTSEVNGIYQTYQDKKTKLETIVQKIQTVNELLNQITKFSGLNIRLDDFFKLKFICARFGRIPKENVDKIKYYSNKPFLFIPFNDEGQDVWCIYLMSNEFERVIDNIMDSLYFQREVIPDFIADKPELEIATLTENKKQLDEEYSQINSDYTNYSNQIIPQVILLENKVLSLSKRNKILRYVVAINNKFLISCFVSKRKLEQFINVFSGIPLEIEVRPSSSDKRLVAPRKIEKFNF